MEVDLEDTSFLSEILEEPTNYYKEDAQATEITFNTQHNGRKISSTIN